jgi:hypothetical protein
MRPLPRAAIGFRNRLVSAVSASTLSWMMPSRVSVSASLNAPVSMSPALLTRIDLEIAPCDLAEERVRRAALAKIAGDHIGLDRIRVDKFGGDLVEPRLVARNQNDGMTMRGKFAGEFETDATRGAGDQRAAAVLGSICHVPALPSRKRGATS